MSFFAGAVLERPPGPKYLASLRYAELAFSGPPPKPSTLARWRSTLPEGFQLALRAPDRCWVSNEGPLRDGPELAQGVQWLTEAIDALRPTLVVIATGAAVSTGARDRERLRAYFANLPAVEGTSVVWRPRGLWEPAAVQSMADTLGVVGGFDAIDDPAPSGALIYASLQAEGLRRAFSHAQLLEVLDKIRAADPAAAFVSVESNQSVREAKLLQALSEGGP